jgi:SulP family sulfate permease
MAASAQGPRLAELFTPKLVTVLREGYGLGALRADAIAGLTVAIVALPLSMAIAIASGVGPERGLYTAIIGGFLVSALGGSRFQIGGPAGAFIVLVASTVATHGVDGLILATMLSGLILLAIGALRLGTFIKYIPYPVTVGFTAGIAVIIFSSQIKDLAGLHLAGPEPAAILPKLRALADAAGTASPAAIALALAAILIIQGTKRFAPRLPGMLIAVVGTALVAALAGLPVETIGSRFGGIPSMLPAPALPAISIDKVIAVLPAALSFALLGSIESLLSAVVADAMTGRRHRSNCELVAQGVANIASALFGGICVTGTIARTATNVRSGARGPVSGMLHALFLLGFMVIAAPLAAYIPLAALAGVLAVVSWNMIERHAIGILLRASRGDAAVLAVTFLLTVFEDLTAGIVAGFSLGALIFLHRMAGTVAVETGVPLIEPDRADSDRPETGGRTAWQPAEGEERAVAVLRISGAFFFGAAATVGATLDNVGAAAPKAYVLDMSAVPLLDSTGAATIDGFRRKADRQGATLWIAAARPAVRHMLHRHGLTPPAVHFRGDTGTAVAAARQALTAG